MFEHNRTCATHAKIPFPLKSRGIFPAGFSRGMPWKQHTYNTTCNIYEGLVVLNWHIHRRKQTFSRIFFSRTRGDEIGTGDSSKPRPTSFFKQDFLVYFQFSCYGIYIGYLYHLFIWNNTSIIWNNTFTV